MPLCPQITNTPITVSLTADYTVTNVVPVVPATTEDVANVVVLVDGKTKAYYQATAPTSGMTEGDIWFDTDAGYKLYYYTGTAWVSVQDTSIAAAQSAATAAQTTADGKNKIYRQGTTPTGTFSVGDLWFNTSNDNSISRWDGSTWVANTLGNNALASISANKITAGTIDASVITVSNINAGNISTGTLAAARIAAGSLDASKITAGTITATQISSSYVYAGTIAAGNITAGTVTAAVSFNAASGTFSGSITASSGTIGGLTIGSTFLYSGSISIYSTGDISSTGTLYFNYISVASASLGSYRFAVQGNSGFYGTVTASGNITAQAYLVNSGIAIQNGTAVHILTGGRLVQSTSSERFKKNIVAIPEGGWLDKVAQIRPVNFQYDEAYCEAPDEVISGLIAEDIAEIPGFEHLIYNDPLGDPFSLSYERLTVFLVMAIKELKAEINKLKGE